MPNIHTLGNKCVGPYEQKLYDEQAHLSKLPNIHSPEIGIFDPYPQIYLISYFIYFKGVSQNVKSPIFYSTEKQND